MNYINKIFKEVSEASAALYSYAQYKHIEDPTLFELVFRQMAALNRLKMRFESSDLFKYREPLDLNDETVKELLNLKTEG